jgi:hypothetical protein
MRALDVECPLCGVQPGLPCVHDLVAGCAGVHQDRINAAMKQTRDDNQARRVAAGGRIP